jgi:alkanesulfonate monooxygenase SsuD/methylene tetrahydromethanopterin reductase-like flavin-dependent oxidoreductase (luciferase family)
VGYLFPLYGDPNANHFEAYSLLGAMAIDTSRAQFGALMTCYAYRNPNLLANMARTIHLLSDGRFILGIGAGGSSATSVSTATSSTRHLNGCGRSTTSCP